MSANDSRGLHHTMHGSARIPFGAYKIEMIPQLEKRPLPGSEEQSTTIHRKIPPILPSFQNLLRHPGQSSQLRSAPKPNLQTLLKSPWEPIRAKTQLEPDPQEPLHERSKSPNRIHHTMRSDFDGQLVRGPYLDYGLIPPYDLGPHNLVRRRHSVSKTSFHDLGEMQN